MRECIARLRFVVVAGGIVAGLWALVLISGNMAEASRTAWPALNPQLSRRALEAGQGRASVGASVSVREAGEDGE